jgi:hypothetical protein
LNKGADKLIFVALLPNDSASKGEFWEDFRVTDWKNASLYDFGYGVRTIGKFIASIFIRS